MSQNIRAYWAAVRKETEALTEPFYYLMSVEDPTRGLVGGVVVQVTKDAAAQALVKKTHRIATPEEVAASQKTEAAKREEYAEAERRRMALLPFYQPQLNPPQKGKAKE